MKINAHKSKHILYLIIEMKTFNVSQFYNGFCCYFKFIYFSFDKVIKLFTLSYLHPSMVFDAKGQAKEGGMQVSRQCYFVL
jgi:hypothetical protein